MHTLDRPPRHLGARDGFDKKVIAADPQGVLDKGMYKRDFILLTRSPPRCLASHADLAPPAPRPGQDTNLGCPSRIGDWLHYRDGSITDLNGQAIADRDGALPALAKYKPLK